MSVAVSAAVWKHGPQQPNARLVLLAIADNCNDEGYAYPLIATIAAKAIMSSRNALRVVAALEEEGWLQREQSPRDARANAYQVNLGKLGDNMSPIPTAAKSATSNIGDTPGTTYVTPGVNIGDIPGIPILKNVRNVREPSVLPKDKPSGDGRFALFRAAFAVYFESKTGVPAPWDAKEATNLARWLKKNPTVTPEQWAGILRNRGSSPVNHAMELSTWIGKAFTWLSREANEFGQETHDGIATGIRYRPVDKIHATAENLAAARARLRHDHDGAGGDGGAARRLGDGGLPGGDRHEAGAGIPARRARLARPARAPTAA